MVGDKVTNKEVLDRLRRLRWIWTRNANAAYVCQDIETGQVFERCADDITKVIRELKEQVDE